MTISTRPSLGHRSFARLAMTCPLGLAIAIVAVLYPPAICGVGGAIVAAGIICWLAGSRKVLQYFPTMLIIAGTKFRGRDAAALIGGSIDSQVMFELGVYAIMGIVVLVNLLSAESLGKPRPLEFALFGYASIALASVGWSVSPAITAVRASQQMLLLITACVAVRVIGPWKLFRSFGCQLLGYVIVCATLAIVVPSFNGTRVGYLAEAHRFSWFAVHPVSAATESGMALVFVTALALYGEGWKGRLCKVQLRFYALALVAIIVATRTRTAMFSTMGAASILYLIRYKRNAGAWILGTLLLTATLLFVIVAPQLGTALQSYVLRGQNLGQFASLTGRTDLWRESLRLFVDRPLLGYGFVASRVLLLQILAWAGEAHNALVESLLDVGVIGAAALFVPFLSGFVGSVKGLNRWRPGDDATVAWVTGALTFLALDGIPMASFAGFLTYDPIVMMTAIVVFQALPAQVESISQFGRNRVEVQRTYKYAY